jgi:hypothetical protein
MIDRYGTRVESNKQRVRTRNRTRVVNYFATTQNARSRNSSVHYMDIRVGEMNLLQGFWFSCRHGQNIKQT